MFKVGDKVILIEHSETRYNNNRYNDEPMIGLKDLYGIIVKIFPEMESSWDRNCTLYHVQWYYPDGNVSSHYGLNRYEAELYYQYDIEQIEANLDKLCLKKENI